MTTTLDAQVTLEQMGWRSRSLPGFAGLVGPLWTRKEPDGWAYGILVSEQHTNPAGLVHGGLFTTLLDHALSSIAWEAADRQPCVTVSLDTNFLSGAYVNQFLEARGRVVKATSSLIFMRGELKVEDAEIAVASAILKVASQKTTPN